MVQSIDRSTSIGIINIGVSDLDRQTQFYVSEIGLSLLSSSAREANLGVNNRELLRLTKIDSAQSERGKTGLYHFAILLPSRTSLGQCLLQLAQKQVPLQGFADHGVSEAIYLGDPEGNGIEIYRDRPRSDWPYAGSQLQMMTEPLDIDGILAEPSLRDTTWTGLPPSTRIGHIHLKVARIDLAESHFTQRLGFDLVQRFGPSAGFVSAGGYHHHIGYNTWESREAPGPSKNATGLRWYSIDLPNQDAVDAVLSRLGEFDLPLTQIEDGWLVPDPSGTHALLRLASPG